MAENIIYCYSGSGHCLSMAKSIAQKLGDTDIVMMRSFPAVTDARGAKRVGFVFSCMAGGLPGKMEEYVRALQISPDSYTFAVEQYAGYLGCGMHKLDEIVHLDYWTGISNHSSIRVSEVSPEAPEHLLLETSILFCYILFHSIHPIPHSIFFLSLSLSSFPSRSKGFTLPLVL